MPSWSRRYFPTLQSRGTMGCGRQDANGPKVIGVVHEQWDVYHGTQYRPLSHREQVPERTRSTVDPSWLPSEPLRRTYTRRHGYDCSACDGFTAFGILQPAHRRHRGWVSSGGGV